MKARCLPESKYASTLGPIMLQYKSLSHKASGTPNFARFMMKLMFFNFAIMKASNYLCIKFFGFMILYYSFIMPNFNSNALLFGEYDNNHYKYNRIYMITCVLMYFTFIVLWALKWARINGEAWKKIYEQKTAGSRLYTLVAAESIILVAIVANLPGLDHGFYDHLIKLNIYLYTCMLNQLLFLFTFIFFRILYLMQEIRSNNIGL